MDLGALIDETLDPGDSFCGSHILSHHVVSKCITLDLLQMDQGIRTHNNGIGHPWSSAVLVTFGECMLCFYRAPAERKRLRRFWKLMEGKMPLSTSSEPKSCGTIFLQSFSWVSQYRRLFFPRLSFNVSVTSGIG